jgi:hypothetical protein
MSLESATSAEERSLLFRPELTSSERQWEVKKEKLFPANFEFDDLKAQADNLRRIALQREALENSREEAQGDYRLFRRAISNSSKRITFKKSIVVVMEEDPGLLIFTHEPTRIFGTGETVREALGDFEDTFIRIYLSYMETPAEQLTNEAVEFTEQLKRIVESCEYV